MFSASFRLTLSSDWVNRISALSSEVSPSRFNASCRVLMCLAWSRLFLIAEWASRNKVLRGVGCDALSFLLASAAVTHTHALKPIKNNTILFITSFVMLEGSYSCRNAISTA